MISPAWIFEWFKEVAEETDTVDGYYTDSVILDGIFDLTELAAHLMNRMEEEKSDK